MACSGFLSIRVFAVVFQIVVLFAILKFFNVDKYLTNKIFGETSVEKQELLIEPSSRYHHRIQEHRWISESEEIENLRIPVITENNDQKENGDQNVMVNENGSRIEGHNETGNGEEIAKDDQEVVETDDETEYLPNEENEAGQNEVENPSSDEKKYLQDLYDLREQEYDADYEEEDYDDYGDIDYLGEENKENLELNITELGFITNTERSSNEIVTIDVPEEFMEGINEAIKDEEEENDEEDEAILMKEPSIEKSNHHQWSKHQRPQGAENDHEVKGNHVSSRVLRIRARHERAKKIAMADTTCNLQIVETVPEALRRGGFAKKMPVEHMSTFQAWQMLVDLAQKDFRVVSQWGIGRRGRGVDFFNSLAKAVTERNVQLSVVFTKKFSGRSGHSPIDMKLLSPRKVMIQLPSIEKKIDGKTNGIIHSKMLISDGKHFYLGSANLGTRCTTWTKEIGMLVTNCPELAEDAVKIHDIYMNIKGELPKSFPKSLSASYNMKKPLKIYNPADETLYKVYLGSSPRRLCSNGRTDDLSAITNIIDNAERFIYIAVGEYLATDIFKEHKSWTVIDERIREAMRRNIVVRFLGNDLASHKNWMKKHLISLMGLNKLNKDIKLMEAKLYKGSIRRFHGSHNKILVTDKAGYLGTSNWAEDYFSTTAGLGFVFEPVLKGFNSTNKYNLRDQLEHVFLRDYYSSLSYIIS